MSLPMLASLPAALSPLAVRAEQSLQQAFAGLSSEAVTAFATWPAERLEALRRVGAASEFVLQQGLRDPQMLLDLAASGELERSFKVGELCGHLAQALADAADEDDLRGEDVDKIDNTCPNIGNILFHHSLSGFIPLRRANKGSTAIGGIKTLHSGFGVGQLRAVALPQGRRRVV